ncbi:MAG: helix-turn-helix transcriptional regulator [Clostridium celatum]|nr:helix-turn-helix transcriptional regulator [Clostridium celatum]
MINIQKLKGKIIEKGLSISELAQKIDINRATLYRKLKDNGENISIKEANLIVKELGLTVEEANSIFFENYVA